MKFPDIRKFFRALRRFFSRPVVVPENISRSREDICRICPNFENGQCAVCTCFVDLKVLMATESCPKGFWKEYFSSGDTGLPGATPRSGNDNF